MHRGQHFLPQLSLIWQRSNAFTFSSVPSETKPDRKLNIPFLPSRIHWCWKDSDSVVLEVGQLAYQLQMRWYLEWHCQDEYPFDLCTRTYQIKQRCMQVTMQTTHKHIQQILIIPCTNIHTICCCQEQLMHWLSMHIMYATLMKSNRDISTSQVKYASSDHNFN